MFFCIFSNQIFSIALAHEISKLKEIWRIKLFSFKLISIILSHSTLIDLIIPKYNETKKREEEEKKEKKNMRERKKRRDIKSPFFLIISRRSIINDLKKNKVLFLRSFPDFN